MLCNCQSWRDSVLPAWQWAAQLDLLLSREGGPCASQDNCSSVRDSLSHQVLSK